MESCHSFTRAVKAVTYSRLQQHIGQNFQPGSHLQLSMTALLLNTLGLEQPEAAIRIYTFYLRQTCPQWLQSWCFRWGFIGNRVTVLALDMYNQSVPRLAGYDLLGYPIHKDMFGCSPVMTLYVPCLV